MNPVSLGLGRTIVVILSTVITGTSLMFAAIGPGLAQASTSPVAAAPRA